MKRYLMILAMLALTSGAFAGSLTNVTNTSGTTTVSYTDYGEGQHCRLLTLAWTCTTGGAVKCVLPVLDGTILRVVTYPADTPTDNYDVSLLDGNVTGSMDLFCGLGQNRDTTATEAFCPCVGNGTGIYGVTSATGTAPVLMAGTSTLIITTAGTSKNGVIYIYLKRED